MRMVPGLKTSKPEHSSLKVTPAPDFKLLRTNPGRNYVRTDEYSVEQSPAMGTVLEAEEARSLPRDLG
jgi:hypothetical protein